MNTPLKSLLQRLSDPIVERTNVIRWGSPVPAFGDLGAAQVATLGLNPSNREFMDPDGNELIGTSRRFHTLKSLGLATWTEVEPQHIRKILDSCRVYFSRNPYDGWFKRLDYLLGATGYSFYDDSHHACHLDLIPYATACKWTELSIAQKSALFDFAGDTLGILLRDSQIKMLILNGSSVVRQFEELTRVRLNKDAKADWTLPRASSIGVAGFAYTGQVNQICGVNLEREILVLGFNHNIQSSFGVTKAVIEGIREWIGGKANEVRD